MSVTKADVQKAAKLAHIEIDEASLEPMVQELAGIISWVEQLNEVDIDGIEPMTSPIERTLPMRRDEISDGGISHKFLSNAPRSEDGFFIVPKVVE